MQDVDMVASGERRLRMMVVHAKHGGGFHVALVPADLSDELVEAAFQEVGIEGAAVLELSDWKTTADNVAIAFIPPLDAN